MIFPLCSLVDSDGKSLHYLDSEQLENYRFNKRKYEMG